MKKEKRNMILERIDPLINQLKNKEFRDGYIDSHVKMFIALQIKNMRGNQTQKEFAQKLNMKQSVISRIENPRYGKVSIQTLLDIAKKLDIALLVRFANYPEFLEVTSDFTENAQKPKPFNHPDLMKMRDDLKSSSATPDNIVIIKVTETSNEQENTTTIKPSQYVHSFSPN